MLFCSKVPSDMAAGISFEVLFNEPSEEYICMLPQEYSPDGLIALVSAAYHKAVSATTQEPTQEPTPEPIEESTPEPIEEDLNAEFIAQLEAEADEELLDELDDEENPEVDLIEESAEIVEQVTEAEAPLEA
jgi:hypothetical protein